MKPATCYPLYIVLAIVIPVALIGEVFSSTPTSLAVEIVCNHPYIRFAAGCCLDQNNNAICDQDETGQRSRQSDPMYESLMDIAKSYGTALEKRDFGQLYDLTSKTLNPSLRKDRFLIIADKLPWKDIIGVRLEDANVQGDRGLVHYRIQLQSKLYESQAIEFEIEGKTWKSLGFSDYFKQPADVLCQEGSLQERQQCAIKTAQESGDPSQCIFAGCYLDRCIQQFNVKPSIDEAKKACTLCGQPQTCLFEMSKVSGHEEVCSDIDDPTLVSKCREHWDKVKGRIHPCVQIGCPEGTRYVGHWMHKIYFDCSCAYATLTHPDRRICLESDDAGKKLNFEKAEKCPSEKILPP